jgi:hypothetical protein
VAGGIFISYRHDDSRHAAGRLFDRLGGHSSATSSSWTWMRSNLAQLVDLRRHEAMSGAANAGEVIPRAAQ